MTEALQVSIQKAAQLLDFHERTVRRLIERGELTAVGSRKLLRVDTASIRAYRERQMRGTTHVEATTTEG